MADYKSMIDTQIASKPIFILRSISASFLRKSQESPDGAASSKRTLLGGGSVPRSD